MLHTIRLICAIVIGTAIARITASQAGEFPTNTIILAIFASVVLLLTVWFELVLIRRENDNRDVPHDFYLRSHPEQRNGKLIHQTKEPVYKDE